MVSQGARNAIFREQSPKSFSLAVVQLQKSSSRAAHYGERRTPSQLGEIQPDHWLAEYTTELINVLNVLGLLVELAPTQAKLLDKVCSGPLISSDQLQAAGAFTLPPKPKKGKKDKKTKEIPFDTEEFPAS